MSYKCLQPGCEWGNPTASGELDSQVFLPRSLSRNFLWMSGLSPSSAWAFCAHIVHNCVRVTHVLWRSVYLRVGTMSYLSLYPLWPSAVSCAQYTPISCLWDKRVSKGMRDSVCPALEVGTGQDVGWMTYPFELSAQCSARRDSGTGTCGWKGAV